MNRKLVLTVVIGLIAALIFGAGFYVYKNISTLPEGSMSDGYYLPEESEDDGAMGRTFTKDGITYRYNSRLRTVLFMGIDSHVEVATHEVTGNGGRADTVLLFVLDPDTKTTRMIEISRDTMTKVDVYNVYREKLYSGTMQINMQYAFGDTPSRSCMLMKDRVSKLLYELPINYYCSVTLDGIASTVDYLGGITLTLADDWTDVNPDYVAGATVTLDGKEAEHFIRYRDTDELESNDVRMARHSWFVREMFRKLRDDPKFNLEKLFKAVDPYLESNLNGETMANLSRFDLLTEVTKLPGQTVAGKHYAEYHLDEEAVQQLLLEVFYKPVE